MDLSNGPHPLYNTEETMFLLSHWINHMLSRYSLDNPTNFNTLQNIIHSNFIKKIRESANLAPSQSQPQETNREKFIRYITQDEDKKKESDEPKEARFKARLSVFDSLVFQSSRWYVRSEFSDQLWQAVLDISPTIRQLVSSFPLNNPESSKPSCEQYCVICCKKTVGPWTKVKRMGLSEAELDKFAIVVNNIRRFRPGRSSRNHDLTSDQLKNLRYCSYHTYHENGQEIIETVDKNSFTDRTRRMDNRKAAAQAALENLRISTAAMIIDKASHVLEGLVHDVSQLQSVSAKELVGSGVTLNSLNEYLQKFLAAIQDYQNLTSTDNLMILKRFWSNIRAFKHDTTFRTPEDLVEFCNQHELELLDVLCVLFYLKGYSYKDLWARFTFMNLSFSQIGRRTQDIVKVFAKLGTEMLRNNRNKNVWQSETPSHWHFANLPYCSDATYLYTEAGINAMILGHSYSTSKSSNLIKILTFTFLSGKPFWISKAYPGTTSDQNIFEKECEENSELLNFLLGQFGSLSENPVSSSSNSSPSMDCAYCGKQTTDTCSCGASCHQICTPGFEDPESPTLCPSCFFLDHSSTATSTSSTTSSVHSLSTQSTSSPLSPDVHAQRLDVASMATSPLDPNSRDLEHIIYGLKPDECKARPIGLLDRGFNRRAIETAFGLLVWIPPYLHGRISLTDPEGILGSYISGRRTVIENYHGVIKRFPRLRNRMDYRIALLHGRDLWLAASFIANLNYKPIRPCSSSQVPQSQNQDEEEDIEYSDSFESDDNDDDILSPTLQEFDLSSLLDSSFDTDDMTLSDSDEDWTQLSESSDEQISSASEEDDVSALVPSRLHELATNLRLKALNFPHSSKATIPLVLPAMPRPLPSVSPCKTLLISSQHPRVRMDESSHTYLIDDIPTLKSFSSLFAGTVPPFKVLAKAVKMAKKDKSCSASDILAKWQYDTSTGTVCHAFMEQFAKEMLDENELNTTLPDVKNRVMKMIKLLRTKLSEGFEIVGSEVVLPDFRAHICGTVDLILRNKRNPNHFIIVDYKSTLKMDLREKLTSKPSTLDIPNTKLNSFAIQCFLYRRAFMNLVHSDNLELLLPEEPITLSDYRPTGYLSSTLFVETAVCTPNMWFQFTSSEFDAFPTYANRLMLNYEEIGQQVSFANRFLLQMDRILENQKQPTRIPIENDKNVRENINNILSTSKVFSGMSTFTKPMISALLPPLYQSDISSFFPSDAYCVSQNTTMRRATTVLADHTADVKLKAAFEYIHESDRFNLYLSASGSSSRGNSKKYSIICFSTSPTGISYSSACSCILGLCRGCAHRARILREIIDSSASHPRERPNQGMSFVKRQRLSVQLLGEKKSTTPKKKKQRIPASSTPSTPRFARNPHLTNAQKDQIRDYKQSNPSFTQIQIASWAQSAFNLPNLPTLPTISTILRSPRPDGNQATDC